MDHTKYKTKLSYPKKLDYKVLYLYHAGKCVGQTSLKDMLPEEIRQFTNKTLHTTHETIVEEDAYRAAKDAYDSDVCKLEKQFMTDLIAEYNLPDDTFTRKLADMAWDKGHSGGFAEVESCFNELSDLYSIAVSTYSKVTA